MSLLPIWCGCSCEEADNRRRAVYEFSVSHLPVQGPFGSPDAQGVPVYSSAPDQPLLGVPLKEGGLWHLSTQDNFEAVTFSLYVNGISFCTEGGLEACISLSPFSLVRNCRFQAGECAKLKSFKLSLLDHDPCVFFAVPSVCEPQAEEERSEWVLGISHTVQLIIYSLLPPVKVTCDPLPGAAHTSRRLLAGYLIRRDNPFSVSVVFCELEAHYGTSARLVIYENDLCDNILRIIDITDQTVTCDMVGINASCFIVDCVYFASRDPSERKLWLRALSNVKVKIQNRAPEATEEELFHYRVAIRGNIRELDTAQVPKISTDALLPRRNVSGDDPLDSMDTLVKVNM